MLVPSIFGISSIIMAAKGIKDGISAISNLSEAKDIINNAKSNYEREYEHTASVIESFINQDLAKIGEKKLEAMRLRERSIEIFSRLIEKLKVSDLELPDKNISVKDIVGEMKVERVQLVEGVKVLEGIVKSAGAAGLAYVGATGTAVAVGTASTGTAIASLSGVAARNAILAWFGGGSLAAGGGGMALGSIVLGGFVVAPALMFGGMVLNKYSEEKLAEAKAYEAKIEAELSKLRIIRNNINHSKKWLKIYSNTLDKLINLTEKLINQLIIIEDKAHNYGVRRFLNLFHLSWLLNLFHLSRYSPTDEEKVVLKYLFIINRSLKEILEIDLIDNTGLYALKKGVEAKVEKLNKQIDEIIQEGVL